jgi:hypothetical protein
MKPKYKDVIIFCPSVITGGPEAMHQLSHSINEQGGSAKIAYYRSEQSSCIIDDGLLICSNPSSTVVHNYRRYAPIIVDQHKLSDSTLMIFPEIETQLILDSNFLNVGIWWLSVDNAVIHNQCLKNSSILKKLFNKTNLLNFYQSDYAKQYLVNNGAQIVVPLSDYTCRSFYEGSISGLKKNVISICPSKGGELASAFLNSSKELNFKIIQKMSREEVVETLKQSLVYIDFGHHPGKDRVPREAIASKAVIFVNHQGSASHYLDYPLDDFYKFSAPDVQSGSLLKKVKYVISNPEQHLNRQAYFQQKVFLEKEEFDLQVKSFFFNR